MLVHQRVTKHPCFCGVHHFGAFTSNNSDSASQLFNTATHHCGGFTIVKKPRFKKIGVEPRSANSFGFEESMEICKNSDFSNEEMWIFHSPE